MTAEVDRLTFVSRGTVAAAALSVGGMAITGAARAAAPSDNDLAYRRLHIASELT